MEPARSKNVARRQHDTKSNKINWKLIWEQYIGLHPTRTLSNVTSSHKKKTDPSMVATAFLNMAYG